MANFTNSPVLPLSRSLSCCCPLPSELGERSGRLGSDEGNDKAYLPLFKHLAGRVLAARSREEGHELALVSTSVTLSEETSGSKARRHSRGAPPPPVPPPPRAGEELDVPDVDEGTFLEPLALSRSLSLSLALSHSLSLSLCLLACYRLKGKLPSRRRGLCPCSTVGLFPRSVWCEKQVLLPATGLLKGKTL